MSKFIQAVRGMNDLPPDAAAAWRRTEDVARRVLAAYGYREIRLPIVEKTELYARSIGEVTDIVEKEMYTFEDRNGDSLTLRPEGTAGCVRAGIEHGLLYNQVQRLWYMGPMFRHERPQKGRYRQFHQIGVEAFGLAGPDIDVEIIAMSARLWRQLGLSPPTLQLNSLGVAESRAIYREELVAYFGARPERLDEDSRRRLHTNPLRILDSKNPEMADLIAGAPRLIDHLDAGSRAHFEVLCAGLDALGIRYEINPRLVRGLDYYSRTVFEWISTDLGAQGTICAGGRYDGLVEQLGGKPTPAIGFAVGLERLIELCGDKAAAVDEAPQVYLAALGADAERDALRLGEQLRDAGVRALLNCGGGNFKKQMQRADRSGARFAVLLGEAEVAEKRAAVKDLRTDAPQQSVEQAALVDFVWRLLESKNQ